jgi:hypothetical protein
MSGALCLGVLLQEFNSGKFSSLTASGETCGSECLNDLTTEMMWHNCVDFTLGRVLVQPRQLLRWTMIFPQSICAAL